VVRAGLAPAVTGAAVASVTVFDERSLRRHDGPSEDFVDRLVGRSFAGASRRGKFMWLPLMGTPEALVVHLGMSGQVLLRDRETDDNLTRIRLDISSPVMGDQRLNFVDQRIFGSMSIVPLVPTLDAAEHVPSQVSHIARDPLDPRFDDRQFFARLATRNSGIKRALLDQSLISGIGNIYADESLWMSKLHYEQPALSLTLPAKKRLLAAVREVLVKALAEGGTSFDEQYKNVNGNSGYFAHSLSVYGQQGLACPRCGRPVVREQFMNRGSHFCPHCQRLRL